MPNFSSVIRELQQERKRLDAAIRALSSLNGAGSLNGTVTSPIRTGRTMSAAARARIAAAQRARWAKLKVKKGRGPRTKRHISAAGIARIRAAAKARWAR